MTAQFLARLLEVIELDIVPLTREGVEVGNKVFGAAILKSSDLSVVVAGTNEETACPLWHGEVVAIRNFHELPPDQRPSPEECLLVSTHEPCPMCLSAIAWAGIPSIYYLFGYEQTRDSFHIPHDLEMLSQVFRCDDGDYARENKYWQSHAIVAAIERCQEGGPEGGPEGSPAPDRERLMEKVERLGEIYAELSRRYQAVKASTSIPLS